MTTTGEEPLPVLDWITFHCSWCGQTFHRQLSLIGPVKAIHITHTLIGDRCTRHDFWPEYE